MTKKMTADELRARVRADIKELVRRGEYILIHETDLDGSEVDE